VTDNQSLGRPILALNCGSSSLKFGLYFCRGAGAELCAEGEAEEIGRDGSSFWLRTQANGKHGQPTQIQDQPAALDLALDALSGNGLPQPDAVGHRLVHGGPRLQEHQRLTPEVKSELQNAAEFAPLHVPPALSVVDAVSRKMPGVPQVVCLDTAFHRSMPDIARTLALPKKVRDLGVERYGFHGISLESILAQLNPIPERLVIAHLGSGCSVTAVRRGMSIDTSMGLTPTGGMMMATRPGDLDPGAIVFLAKHGYNDAEQLEHLLDYDSGLKGISGNSGDFRELTERRQQDGCADLALRMFSYQLRKTIASMAAALGGMDRLVLTGGIGEHSDAIRSEMCRELSFMSDCTVQVLPAQEDLQIARTTARLTA
jgi:acetate kinase